MLAVPPLLRCEVLAWDDVKVPILVVEDLRDAHWPPPWRPGDVARVLAALERLWAAPTPDFFTSAEDERKTFSGWAKVASQPDGFLGLQVCSPDWLTAHISALVEAEARAVLGGSDFLHLDIRSDNLCLTADRVVLVDWNFACRGNREIDLALWLPSLSLETGDPPDALARVGGEYAAAWTGVLANGARLPDPRGAPGVRSFQLRQLRVALPWTCRLLDFPEPVPA
jgi:hypothetical protein